MGPLKTYQKRLNKGDLKPDPEQEQAAYALQRVYEEVVAYKPKKGWFSKREDPPKGLYMYGGVGRGKSMLMDLFFECLPKDMKKERVHFHEFMIGVHDYIHSRREAEGGREGVDATLPLLACRIAERSRVLCFDEFHVTDVADAMILGRLFRAVFEQGVTVVATSNWEPDRLYEGGLKRDRFLPFIELLKDKMDVLHLNSPTDYRTKFLASEGTYFYPFSAETTKKVDALFKHLTDDAEMNEDTVEVKGRTITVPRAAKGIARFTFPQLCEQPHGAEDFLALSRRYHTVFLENTPKMGYDRSNEAKRFMIMVDTFYEMGTRLVIGADAPPHKLYYGDDLAFEFERTVSRLLEMQSAEYLTKMD